MNSKIVFFAFAFFALAASVDGLRIRGPLTPGEVDKQFDCDKLPCLRILDDEETWTLSASALAPTQPLAVERGADANTYAEVEAATYEVKQGDEGKVLVVLDRKPSVERIVATQAGERGAQKEVFVIGKDFIASGTPASAQLPSLTPPTDATKQKAGEDEESGQQKGGILEGIQGVYEGQAGKVAAGGGVKAGSTVKVLVALKPNADLKGVSFSAEFQGKQRNAIIGGDQRISRKELKGEEAKPKREGGRAQLLFEMPVPSANEADAFENTFITVMAWRGAPYATSEPADRESYRLKIEKKFGASVDLGNGLIVLSTSGRGLELRNGGSVYRLKLAKYATSIYGRHWLTSIPFLNIPAAFIRENGGGWVEVYKGGKADCKIGPTEELFVPFNHASKCKDSAAPVTLAHEKTYCENPQFNFLGEKQCAYAEITYRVSFS